MESEAEPPSTLPLGANNGSKKRKWREWHEREHPVEITGRVTDQGVRVSVVSEEMNKDLELVYPNSVWKDYLWQNKTKFLDNVTYLFTAHLPFLLHGNIRLDYTSTGYPHVFSWANQCFMRFLPSYWFVYRGRKGTKVFPMLKTMMNSRASFIQRNDVAPKFPVTKEENIVMPFTFGKDSFLSYFVAKEMGLNPILVYFNEPTEMYSRDHKLKLIENFSRETGEKIYFMDNPLGELREYGEGLFGWELPLTSWALLSLPFAYKYEAAYILFSNEKSTGAFFYDEDGMRVSPDYEQLPQATEEISIFMQTMSEGEVYVTNFLAGIQDLGIVALLKYRYGGKAFPYLMSCWAETEAAKDKRWCATCSKCARLYIYMTANGIDPIEEGGFQDNMLVTEKEHLYNVFGKKASGTGWDAFGLNTDEQALAFYLSYLRGNRDPLVVKFMASELAMKTQNRFKTLLREYYGVHREQTMPPQWKGRIEKAYRETLKKVREELIELEKSQNQF